MMVASCGIGERVFECTSSAACTRGSTSGRCEATGYCSFPAEDCTSGSRYGEYAGSGLGDRCVPQRDGGVDSGVMDGGVHDSPADAGAPDGSACATAVAAGGRHSCAVLSSGVAACWGSNSYGEIGTGSTSVDHYEQPEEVAGLLDVALVAAGEQHTCARLLDLAVWCWGSNVAGELGRDPAGTGNGVPSAGQVSPLAGAGAIAAGSSFSCALRAADGTVWCWGSNDGGQLGVDPARTEATHSAVQVAGLSGASSIAAGQGHTCAIVSDGGAAWCWGLGDLGQLGNGTSTSSYVPVQATGISDAVEVRAGEHHTCARKIGGSVYCWGGNLGGQTGQDLATRIVIEPARVTLPDAAIAIAAGGIHTCAVVASDRSVWCWGDNSSSQIGAPSDMIGRGAAPLPVHESSGEYLAGVTAISAGARHTCAMKADGSVWCWGDNSQGQLGLSASISAETPAAIRVSGLGCE